MSAQQPEDVYTHGHHESVVRAHASRTAENSAAFVIPHLTPGTSVLDVGCGPGSITCDFAMLVAPGTVTGLDRSADVIAHARARLAGYKVPKSIVFLSEIARLGSGKPDRRALSEVSA